MEEINKKRDELLSMVSDLLKDFGDDGNLELVVHRKLLSAINKLRFGIKNNGVIN